MKFLITGANGLLGKNLISKISFNNEITAIVRTFPSEMHQGVHYIPLDLSNEFSEEKLPSQVDVIIHLAQSINFRNFPERALDVFQVNVSSTAYLLDYARRAGAHTFIYASSGGVYGNGNQAFSENSPIIPPRQLGYYLGSKLCGEVLAQSYVNHFQVIVLRYFFMYGPNQNRSMLIPRLVDSIKNRQPITIQGSEGIRINPIHVMDAVDATLATLNIKESSIFNIAGPDIISLRNISEEIGRYLNIDPQFNILHTEPLDLIGDNTAMQKKLIIPKKQLYKHLHEINQ
ncbi:MAG: NAD(P)-dependent oxidoreductase [Candidatus Thiothrix moscowensis]|nr:NAD(P)-dependent oxidoreductase [Candidatus Thiothrix moscowensis]